MAIDQHWIPNWLGSILIDGVPLATVIDDAVAAAGGMTEEQVYDLVGQSVLGGTKLTAVVDDGANTVTLNLDELNSTDIADFAAAVNALIAAATIDADTLGGDTKASIISQAVASVVGGAAAAYDTLVEIQALMEADDTQTTGMLTSIAGRARFYAEDITAGAPTDTVTHGLALATPGDFTYRIFVKATGVPEDYRVTPNDANTVLITDETGANIPAGRRIIITAGAS
jgi:hypothetical protein